MQRAGIDFETAWEGTKFTAGVLGVVESSKEVFNSVWQNKNAVANSKLITLGRVIGVIGILDHSQSLVNEVQKGGFSNAKVYYYTGALLIDGALFTGKVTNPYYLGGAALFSIVDGGLNIYWNQQEIYNQRR